jgi:glycopeptide antibiotics resistance protein
MRSIRASDMRPPHHETGIRLSRAVLIYYFAVIAVITLVPFHFDVAHRLRVMLSGTPLDFGANILLFIPLGYLARLARPAGNDTFAVRALLIGTAVSLLIEVTQLFEPARFASPLDILANGGGAWVGALIADRLASRIRPESIVKGRLSLEIPLMGLSYMLVPLLWLGSLSAGHDTGRLALLLLPGLFGGQVIVFVHRFHLAPRAMDTGAQGGRASRNGVALAAGGGMLVGLVPALPVHPLAVIVLATLVALSVRVQVWLATDAAEGDRRFEMRALRHALPLFAGYLVAAAWMARPSAAGSGVVAFPALDRIGILRLLEMVAAFTVLGYLVAEWRGRLELNGLEATLGVLVRAAPLALLAIAGRFLPDDSSAALLWFVISVGSSGYGAVLYQLQRSHVRRLIEATADPSSPRIPRHVAA